MLRKVTLKIPNLSCDACIRRLEKAAIWGSPGIVAVSMRRRRGAILEVSVTYEDGEMTFDRIRAAFMELENPIGGFILHGHEHSHGEVVHSHEHRH